MIGINSETGKNGDKSTDVLMNAGRAEASEDQPMKYRQKKRREREWF